MRPLLTILIFIVFVSALNGQTYNIFRVISKSDKIFTDTVGNNFKIIKVNVNEVRTINKKGIYDYYSLNSKKTTLIPNSIEYLVTYKIQYPDLNFKTEIGILMNSKFQLKDRSTFENIPNYIKRNTLRDIITKDSAIEIAKNSGLAKGDTLTIELFNEYKTKQFFWSIGSEWKSYFAKLEKEYKNKGYPRRRRRRTKDELFINAKTGEAFTYEQMPN